MRATLFAASILFVSAIAPVHANSYLFGTPGGSTIGGQPVDATALFTTGAGTLTITLTDLQANPTDVSQTISDLDFVLSTGAKTGTLSSSSGQVVTVNGDGTYSIGSTGPTGWGLNNNVSGGLQLDALGYIGPAGLIIGPPGLGGKYTDANGSIAGNGPHNPFINQSATFTIAIAGVTSSTAITGATFSFGTTAGTDNLAAAPVPTPEPTALGLGLLGLLALGAFKRKP